MATTLTVNGAYCKIECVSVLSVGQEHHDIEIDTGLAWTMNPPMMFSVNGEYLVSAHSDDVRVWRVEDGREMARLEVKEVECLAVSKDDNWIATGTFWGDVIVWDANTYKQKYRWRMERDTPGYGLDFSPDVTQLVAASTDKTAIIWDVATGNEVRTLVHDDWVRTVKYSPQGDRITTATSDHVRVWDSENGRLMHEIPASCRDPVSLVWGNNLVFVVSMDKVWKIQGTNVSEWSIPDTNKTSCTALQSRGEFVVSATSRTVRFWDILTHAQLSPIQHSRDVSSTALSPDDQFIAIAGYHGEITIKRLSHISVSVVPSCISTSLFCLSLCLRVAFLSMSLNTPHIVGTNHSYQ